MALDRTLLFLLFTLLAEIIGTIGGFGSSVFFVPFANIFFDFHTVLGITAVFHLSSNLSKIFLFRKGFRQKVDSTNWNTICSIRNYWRFFE